MVMKARLHAPMGPLGLGNLDAAPRAALVALLPQTNEHDGEFGPEHGSWKYWEMGRTDGEMVYVAERVAHGPREPALVWTGSRWICSEDDLTDLERELMDRVAAKCPGGLAGWS